MGFFVSSQNAEFISLLFLISELTATSEKAIGGELAWCTRHRATTLYSVDRWSEP